MGLKQEGDVRRGPKGVQHMEEHGCLSHARPRNQTDKTAVRFNTVVQGRRGFLVGFAQI